MRAAAKASPLSTPLTAGASEVREAREAAGALVAAGRCAVGAAAIRVAGPLVEDAACTRGPVGDDPGDAPTDEGAPPATTVGNLIVAEGAPPGGNVGNLIVGEAVGLGGKLMRTVSFFGCTLAASAGLGGTAPPGRLGIFSAITFNVNPK